MQPWEQKLKDNFGTAVVDKQLAMKNDVDSLPRYVSEYLFGFFCQDGVNEDSISEMHEYINSHLVTNKEKEPARHELQTNLQKKIIDKFKVQINLTNKKEENNTLEIPTLGEKKAVVYDSLLKDHPRLLMDGLWGLAQIEFDIEDREIRMTQFKPFQLSDISLEDFIEARKEFTTDEWINSLVSTIGLDYSNYSYRQKLIILSRLIPMVEKNVFMMEFGLPGTGKTYAYEEISSYSRVISGSKVTEAQLFYNLNTNKEGLLSQYDAVMFDEIDKVKGSGIDTGVINKLYQYLASGKFDRGNVEKHSNCGVVMVGNMPKGEIDKRTLLAELLHESMVRDAFLDRMAGVIPGWELEPIKNREESLTKHYGFTADYFSEILNQLRELNTNSYINSRISLINASIRDEDAITRTVSGLIKLIYPHLDIPEDEFKSILDFSVELRQFVTDQIYYIHQDPKFNKKLEYTLL